MIEFEWDERKERENLRKHKISFLEAIESFSDPYGFALVDKSYLVNEARFYWVGINSSGKVITTRFTRRAGKIRIIGAAEWREFRSMYNEKTKVK